MRVWHALLCLDGVLAVLAYVHHLLAAILATRGQSYFGGWAETTAIFCVVACIPATIAAAMFKDISPDMKLWNNEVE